MFLNVAALHAFALNLTPIQRRIPMSNHNNENEPRTDTIAETENFVAWKAEEPDGETTYHVELNNVTVHFFEEEWTEFLQLARMLK
jgi:hypothetical protein